VDHSEVRSDGQVVDAVARDQIYEKAGGAAVGEAKTRETREHLRWLVNHLNAGKPTPSKLTPREFRAILRIRDEEPGVSAKTISRRLGNGTGELTVKHVLAIHEDRGIGEEALNQILDAYEND
jgi:hypothetical protein